MGRYVGSWPLILKIWVGEWGRIHLINLDQSVTVKSKLSAFLSKVTAYSDFYGVNNINMCF